MNNLTEACTFIPSIQLQSSCCQDVIAHGATWHST